MKKVLTYIVKSIEALVRTGYLLVALAIILAVSYLVGGYAYLSGAWGTDTQSYIAMLVWFDKFYPNVPFWYPLAGGGVSLTHAYPALSFYIVSFIKNLFDLNLISALSVVGYGSIIVIALSIYSFVALRFKNQTAALIAAICYLISPISWTWLTNWGFYAESISHTFIVPTILFFDLFFASVINKNYGVKTRLYLFFTILFITLTTATHFLSGYAVMGIFYFYLLIYFLFSKGERKSVLINGIIALFIVGILSLAATSAFTTPFTRYAKFASIGGVGPASPPTIKDYQQVLPSIRNIVGLDEIQRGTFLHGMNFFKFPVVVSALALMGVLFYSWKDKRKWVYSFYGLFGIFLAFSPYYYVYFLNKLPLGFIASSFGWRPMYAVMRMVIPILSGLGLAGLFSLPFFWIKNKIIRYPINIIIASLSLITFAFVLVYSKPTSKPIVYNYGASGIDTKNIWGVRDAEGNMIGFDICPDKDFESDEERIIFDEKFEKVGGWQRWCNSAMKKYFPPSQVVSWCDLEEKKGNSLPVICSPETVTSETALQFWNSCKDGREHSEVCKYAYFNLEEQLKLSAWPKPNLATGFNPNEGLNKQLEIIEKDNPKGRIDFSPFMGGDSMMAPLYNIGRSLSQIHIYVASASLIHRFQGFQQIVYYLNSPMYDDPQMINDINKWFGINYVFDVPSIYSTSEENLFKRAGWEVFSGDWGNGIYKYPNKNELAELTSKKTVLVIGQKEFATYDQVFMVSLLGTLPYDNNILVWGKDKIDDYSLTELKKYDMIILQGYNYSSKGKTDSLLTKYVNEGGGVFIDTGWQYKNPDWESKNTLNIIPLKTLSWNNLGQSNDYNIVSGGNVNSDLDKSGFGPLVYDNGPWGVSTSEASDLKPWAKTEVSVSGKPIIVSGVLGQGKIVWSGMNIFAHAKQKETLYKDEIKVLKNSFDWLASTKEPKNYQVSYQRENPDKVIFSLPQTESPTFLFWKEGFYEDFKANLNLDGKDKKLTINRAGPGFVLIEVPKLDKPSIITYEYKTPFVESFAKYLSVFTFLTLLFLIAEGVRGKQSAVFKFQDKLEKLLNRTNNTSGKNQKTGNSPLSWLKDDSGDENY